MKNIDYIRSLSAEELGRFLRNLRRCGESGNCIADKDYGTCDHCGAPLKDEEEEYSVKIKPIKPITRYRYY